MMDAMKLADETKQVWSDWQHDYKIAHETKGSKNTIQNLTYGLYGALIALVASMVFAFFSLIGVLMMVVSSVIAVVCGWKKYVNLTELEQSVADDWKMSAYKTTYARHLAAAKNLYLFDESPEIRRVQRFKLEPEWLDAPTLGLVYSRAEYDRFNEEGIRFNVTTRRQAILLDAELSVLPRNTPSEYERQQYNDRIDHVCKWILDYADANEHDAVVDDLTVKAKSHEDETDDPFETVHEELDVRGLGVILDKVFRP